jgi:hypothetical protein
MKLKTLAISTLALLAAANLSYADIVYGNGVLTTSSPTAHVTGQSTTGSGIHYYNVFELSVSQTGTYIFELSSRNTTGTPSNALDTWLAIFANNFNPAAPGTPQNSNDDFTGTLTVLPGPFSGIGLTNVATGFTGAQPASRLATVNLVAGTRYFMYVSSFRETNYITTGSQAQPTGAYYYGISGAGIITVVPEPTTVALFGFGALAVGVAAWRKRKAA